jgi:hypothetical protein
MDEILGHPQGRTRLAVLKRNLRSFECLPRWPGRRSWDGGSLTSLDQRKQEIWRFHRTAGGQLGNGPLHLEAPLLPVDDDEDDVGPAESVCGIDPRVHRKCEQEPQPFLKIPGDRKHEWRFADHPISLPFDFLLATISARALDVD